ncbi:hypothetical protein PIB30_102032 [Stylosanthes scabra]|uniref:Uncharacterized protein n=1 Tax=Stylosanthes scabra TaxID=79078 RepID=A0ABU6ZW68_9FABA|nr:hypothetical protein [Stylosanthes scabra]
MGMPKGICGGFYFLPNGSRNWMKSRKRGDRQRWAMEEEEERPYNVTSSRGEGGYGDEKK